MTVAMKTVTVLIPCVALLAQAVGYGQDAKPIVDNERVAVTELAGFPVKVPIADSDLVWIAIARGRGTAFFEPKGKSLGAKLAFQPERTIRIALKDHPVSPLGNNTGLPNAFPRPGVQKLIENDRVIVWEYTWMPGRPTPMHFHDKDVVVVYLDDGALQSTTPDGKKVVNPYTYGQAKFNARDRTHTELLIDGHQHAIMMELK